MIKLKKKTKPIVSSKIKPLVILGKPIARLGASTKRYSKTHWVSPLTDAQKFFIATTTDMPHTFKGLPLSKGNAEALELYKRFSEDFHVGAKRQHQLQEKARNNLSDSAKRQEVLVQRQEELMQKAKADFDASAKLRLELTYTKLKEFRDINEKEGEITRERLRLLNKKADAVRGDGQIEYKAHLDKKILEAQIALNKEKMAREYQNLGQKLRMSGGIASLPEAQGFPKFRSISTHYPSIPATQVSSKLQANKLAVEINKERKLKVGNGLNQLMTDNKLKKPLDIADAYLKANSKPDFYIVDSMDNPVALAEATGISPMRLFEMVCVELKNSKKKYEKYELERRGIGTEALINLYESKVASNKGKKDAMKYTIKKLFFSKERKDWSELFNYNWKDYKRFSEDFNRWNKIFKSEATKREDLDADKFKDWVKEN